MKLKKRKYAGWMLVEAVVAISVLGVIVSALLLATNSSRKFNHYQLARQQCLAAAQAQLDSITATGLLISDDDIKRLWPKVTITIDRADGSETWQGLKLVRVKARTERIGKVVEVTQARYVDSR